MRPDLLGVAAEILAILSGILLLIPTFSFNRTLRRIGSAKDRFAPAKDNALGKITEGVAGPTLADAASLKWSRTDQTLLQAGLAALITSSVFKLFIAIGWGDEINEAIRHLL